MSKWLSFLIFLFLLLSCNREEKNIIPRKDLVPILIDMHITDAIAMNHMISEQFGGLDSALLYNAIFEKHGYTKEQIIGTLRYYSGKPDALVKIYDDVFSEMSKMAEEAHLAYTSTNNTNTNLFWKPDTNKYRAVGDTVNYPPSFDIAIDTNGTYVITAEIKITAKDSSVNPRINAFFYRPGKDSLKSMVFFDEESLFKTDFMREYRAIKEYRNKLPARLKIIIPAHDSPDTTFMKWFEMQNLHVALVRNDKEN